MTSMRELTPTGSQVVTTVALTLVAGAVFASCLLSGYDKVEGGEGGAGGGTTSTVGIASSSTTSASSAGGEDLPICATTEYPDGPTNAAPGGGRETWFALRSIALGDPDDPASVPGFDLDRVDSCNEACRGIDPECSRPDFLADLSAPQEAQRCDWPSAVDNTAVYLFESAALTLGATDLQLSEEANAGGWSFLLRLSAWNGTANDAEVTLALFATKGWEPPPDAGAGGGGGAAPVPAWDGTDTWSIDARSLVDPENVDTPSFRTDTAYISGGTLVAELGGLFYVGDTRFPIQIATGRLVAPLDVTDPLRPKMVDAVFAGRWPVTDLIAGLGSLLVGNGPFCEQTTLFNPVVERACQLVDVTTASGLGTCSALSFGIQFGAETVVPGTIVPPEGDPPTCPAVTCESLLLPP